MVTQRQMEAAIAEAVRDATTPLIEKQKELEQKIVTLSNRLAAKQSEEDGNKLLDEWMNGENNG